MSRDQEKDLPNAQEPDLTTHDREDCVVSQNTEEVALRKHSDDCPPADIPAPSEDESLDEEALLMAQEAFLCDEEDEMEEIDHVDIYAEPPELYEDADEDEVLDAEEEITEETVEEAIEDAIEEVEADIKEEEEILAEQRPQEMEKKFEYLEELLNNRHYADFRTELGELNPVDAAEFFDELEPKRIPSVFKLLDKDTAAAVFAELEIEEQERIITAMTDREISLMVEELALDDTTEMLKELPANIVRRIMKNATPETRTDINRFLAYPEDSAGSVMTAEFIDLRRDMTCAEAIARIRKTGVDKETVYVAYVAPLKEAQKFLNTQRPESWVTSS